MEVYYKFASAKENQSISIDWHYTTLADLKKNIFKKKFELKGKNRIPSDNLIITNAQTNEEYVHGDTLIPKNTSLIIRRVPQLLCKPIIIPPDKPLVEIKLEDVDVSVVDPQESQWREFWNYLSTPQVQDAPPSKANEEEDTKIRPLIDTPALDCPPHSCGFGHRMGGRSHGAAFGRGGGGSLERITPPPGYICHRCKVPGHFIQHCSTNGDPTFDIKRVKSPTGIPKSMSMATPDGSYALPSRAVAVSKPNVAAVPKELHCPLCRAVMKDAVFASKCCFNSFCDKCIRDYIISKSLCVCGATNVLADYLLPNKTLRDIIVRILESNNIGGAKGGSAFQPKDTESARSPQHKIQCPKVPSPVLPDTLDLPQVYTMPFPPHRDLAECGTGFNGGGVPSIMSREEFEAGETTIKQKRVLERSGGGMEVSRDGDFNRDMISHEEDPSAKSKLKSITSPDYQQPLSRSEPDHITQDPELLRTCSKRKLKYDDNYYAEHPYQHREKERRYLHRSESVSATRPPVLPDALERSGGGMEVSRDGHFNRDMISHEEVPSAKSKLKSITSPDYQQPLSRSEPDHITQDPELLRTCSKRKVKYDDNYYAEHPHQHREKEHRYQHRSESVSATRPPVLPNALDLPPLPSKSSTSKTISDLKHNATVFARITSPEGESAASKKRKLDSTSDVNGSSHHSSHRTTSNGYHVDYRKIAAALLKNNYNFADDRDYESSDDDRHFKRRRFRYGSSPAPAVVEGRHSSRGSREKASSGILSVY